MKTYIFQEGSYWFVCLNNVTVNKYQKTKIYPLIYSKTQKDTL